MVATFGKPQARGKPMSMLSGRRAPQAWALILGVEYDVTPADAAHLWQVYAKHCPYQACTVEYALHRLVSIPRDSHLQDNVRQGMRHLQTLLPAKDLLACLAHISPEGQRRKAWVLRLEEKVLADLTPTGEWRNA